VWHTWVGVALAAAVAGGVPAAATPPSTVCTVTDPRLDEISGLARTADGFAVVDDSSTLSNHWRVFFLDNRCAVTRAVRYPSTPRDTEDMAQARDGTLWIGDIGDNSRSRQTVALWRLAKGGRSPVLFRLAYPDGAHDAEALVLSGDGTPVIVTKDLGTALLYQPAAALRAGATVPLRKVGAFDLPSTGTSNPFSFPGRLVVTGGANAPDGSRVVLRTYADAFEFTVTGGDVVRAITTGRPRLVPLPDEPQGESIAYDRDGVSLLTVSEKATVAQPLILRYPAPVPPSRPAAPGTSRAAVAAAPAARTGRVSTVVGVLGGGGLFLVVVGAIALGRHRTRRG
jgi:hypothetical protein